MDLFLGHLKGCCGKFNQGSPSELYAPASYILSIGGKRVRPLMALVGNDLFNGEPNDALDAALSVELFHNFSLIHDDILDNAPIRRNQPTVHNKWNHNIAILSGDVMLVEALRALEHYSDPVYRQLSSLLSETAVQVCEGQQMDMNFETAEKVSASEYIRMITFKTAVLLGCSLKMGAVTARATEKDQQNLYQFGKHLGIAFQLMDDLLDVFPSDQKTFGKKYAGDIVSNKKTFLLIKTLELADASQTATIADCYGGKAMPEIEKIETVSAIFRQTGADQLCRNEAELHTAEAVRFLDSVNADPKKKELLTAYSKQLLGRTI
jgi:geranylgeranyl diphosphate synthase, type II